MKICEICNLLPVEAEIFTRRINPNKKICLDCVRVSKIMKEVLDMPSLLIEYKPKKKKKKNKEIDPEIKRFIDYVATDPEYEKRRKENLYLSYQKRYFKTENGKAAYRMGYSLRRARVKNAIIELSKEEKQKIKEFYKNRPDGYDVDHIIPISKGGKHCLINLQYIPSYENRMKRNKIYIEVLEKFLEDEPLSISFLQRKFRMSYEEAKKILEEIGKI